MLSLIEKKREKIYLFYEYFMEITLYNFFISKVKKFINKWKFMAKYFMSKKSVRLKEKALKVQNICPEKKFNYFLYKFKTKYLFSKYIKGF
jgi:hypothetical protein